MKYVIELLKPRIELLRQVGDKVSKQQAAELEQVIRMLQEPDKGLRHCPFCGSEKGIETHIYKNIQNGETKYGWQIFHTCRDDDRNKAKLVLQAKHYYKTRAAAEEDMRYVWNSRKFL